MLVPALAAVPDFDFAAWPPEGAEALDTGGLYERLASGGLEYGPAFRGLRGAWRLGQDVYADVALPEELALSADRYGVHPALLDAALHALGADPAAGGPARVPFAWTGVAVRAAGARALRARLTWTGPDTVTVAAADQAGTPVLSAQSMVLRPAAGMASAAAERDWLFKVEWTPVPAPAGTGADATAPDWAQLTPQELIARASGSAELPGTVVVTWPHRTAGRTARGWPRRLGRRRAGVAGGAGVAVPQRRRRVPAGAGDPRRGRGGARRGSR